jgi:hypothetical protein
MRGYRKALAALALVAGLAAAPASAQSDPAQCELHVWPTRQFYAVYHGASSGGWLGLPGLTLTLTPMDEVAKRVGLAADPESQARKIAEMKLEQTAAFRGYRIVFHEAPEGASPFAKWTDKNVAKGPRYGDSTAPCYAELHVIFVTLFRTAISKKIQTAFVFREFGPTGDTTFDFIDAGSTGAPAFDTGAQSDDAAARASVQDAFAENLRIFLGKKKMRARFGRK